MLFLRLQGGQKYLIKAERPPGYVAGGTGGREGTGQRQRLRLTAGQAPGGQGPAGRKRVKEGNAGEPAPRLPTSEPPSGTAEEACC